MVFLEQTQNLITHTHPIWGNVFFYLLFTVIIVGGFLVFRLIRNLNKKTTENILREQQHVAKLDNIRRENTERLEHIRVEMLRKEEESTRQWMESEKETLHVLNGVSNLLEITNRISKVEFEKIHKGLEEIKTGIDNEKKLNDK